MLESICPVCCVGFARSGEHCGPPACQKMELDVVRDLPVLLGLASENKLYVCVLVACVASLFEDARAVRYLASPVTWVAAHPRRGLPARGYASWRSARSTTRTARRRGSHLEGRSVVKSGRIRVRSRRTRREGPDRASVDGPHVGVCFCRFRVLRLHLRCACAEIMIRPTLLGPPSGSEPRRLVMST